MREELEKIVKKFYDSEFKKYKKESGDSDEECKWSVSEFVVSEIDDILSEIVEEEKVAGLSRFHYYVNMISYYIVEVEGEGCYCLCYDDVDGNRVVVDWDLEIRED